MPYLSLLLYCVVAVYSIAQPSESAIKVEPSSNITRGIIVVCKLSIMTSSRSSLRLRRVTVVRRVLESAGHRRRSDARRLRDAGVRDAVITRLRCECCQSSRTVSRCRSSLSVRSRTRKPNQFKPPSLLAVSGTWTVRGPRQSPAGGRSGRPAGVALGSWQSQARTVGLA